MDALTAASSGGGSAGAGALLYVTPEKLVASKRLISKLEKLHQVYHRACPC